ncbi:MAG TPA: ABC transporter permease [Bacteroidales bacterium]|nr:ABC transporter permease [Bacteroidales bacterium]
MFSSDIKTALRNILRNKVSSSISIFGLSIGLGCIIILLALVVHEKSFDRFIPGYRSVYRITLGNNGLTQYPLAEAMANEFPEVKSYFRYYGARSLQIRTGNNVISRENAFGFADASVFRILGIKMMSGIPASTPGEVAISKKAALKYFGAVSPLGSILQVKIDDGFTPLTVTGVYENFPSNSSLVPSVIADIKLSEKVLRQFQQSLGEFGDQNNSMPGWDKTEFLTYVTLEKNSDPVSLAERMEKYVAFVPGDNKSELHYRLQPVAEIYLKSSGISGQQFLKQGNPQDLIYYEIISLMILVISLANYVLLTRAGVADRIHNLGTRKVFGASYGKIRRLIIIESFVIVIVSLLPATFIVDSGMGLVNSTLNKTIAPEVFLNPLLLLILTFVIVFTGIAAGWLIGLYYSKIPALDLITGRINNHGRSGRLNYAFLSLHFMIFIVFVSGIIGITKQLEFSKTAYIGIDPKDVLVSDLTSTGLMSSFNTIRNEMENIPGVKAVAGGTFIPPFAHFLPVTLATAEGEKVRFDGLIMGEGMTQLLGMEVIDGESFGPYKGGTPEVLINESTAKKYNVRAGEKLLAFQVKGVVKDFNAHSMHSEIQPLVILQQNPERMSLIAVKTDGRNDEIIKEKLRQLYSRIAPDEIFEVSYLTDRIDDFYASETNQAKLIGAFAVLTAVLSVMGLFGISLISITRRRKEIGLRKVNGASTREVLVMVNVDFIKWVLIAFIASVPLSVFLLNKWLERFAYRTELRWWIFAAAGMLAIIVAILTVSWQSVRAARQNPVEALRYE